MKLGLIGCGKMGGALLEGVIKAKLVKASQVAVCDVHGPSAAALQKKHPGLKVLAGGVEVIKASDTVILAVKPKDMETLLRSAAENAGKKTEGVLFLSIAAGITLSHLQSWLEGVPRIIRVMPNTPAQIGLGYSAFARATGVADADAEVARRILGAVGLVDEVDEKLLDAITGLSGSGPAYVFTVIESLADAGVLMGLGRDAALRAAAQTVAGAAQMVIQTGELPAKLRDAVTSPGGTTIAGLEQLEAHGLRNALIQAVRKATERSRELGK